MYKRWLRLFGTATERAAASATPAASVDPDAAEPFSLARLARENAELAGCFLWGTNALPSLPEPWWLHLGCGERVFEGFVNLDFIPHDVRVQAWQLLDLWPEALAARVQGVFSEDVLEHFFLGEQVYILCNVNRALVPGGVARTLMPSLARLVDYRAAFKPEPDDFLHGNFGVETGADALNLGLRFSGHRWLHDAQSLGRLAALCGFEVTPTACATSTIPKFDGLNLRDEADSLSFASDLAKVRTVERRVLLPRAVAGAAWVETVADGIDLYVASEARPVVEYAMANPLDARAVACINIRSSNLSSFAEHNVKSLVVDDINGERPWYYDETLKSRTCMNLVERNELRLILGGARSFSRLAFHPAARSGEHFTTGCAEIYSVA